MTNNNRDNLRTEITGSVFPVPTPFLQDGSAVDHDALSAYVEFVISNGAEVVMTTVGTSRFNLLCESEILDVNKTVTETASGRATVIVAGSASGSLTTNIKAAQHASTIGADAYIAFFPERWYTDDSVYNFFEALARNTDTGVMIHEMPIRSGYGGSVQYSLDLLERLIDTPGIVGMKEESMDGGHAYKIHRSLSDKCAIIGAGAMRNFLRDSQAGARANLVGIGSFFPRVELAFHNAIKNGKFDLAQLIVKKYEDPYFDFAVLLGWHVQLKETLHIMGLMPAHERPPLERLTSEKRKELSKLIQKMNWADLDPSHKPELSHE